MNFEKLYSTILHISRNVDLYQKYKIKDTLDNKVILLLIHFSFIFNKLKNNNLNKNQKLFDYIFSKIETDLREIGLGDMSVNKKMKIILNKFYCILLDFDHFIMKPCKEKIKLMIKLLKPNKNNDINFLKVINYINKFAKKIDLISPDDIYRSNFY